MSADLSIRPRFKFISELSVAEVFERLEKGYQQEENQIVGSRSRNHVYLHIPEEFQHYWSPKLDLSVIDEEGDTVVRGLIGPKAKVWGLFMFMYAVIILVTLFGTLYGLTNLNLGIDSNWCYCFPIGAVLFIFVFIAAKFGQKKGKVQMAHLQEFVDKTLDHIPAK